MYLSSKSSSTNFKNNHSWGSWSEYFCKRSQACEYHHQPQAVTVSKIKCCGFSEHAPHCLEKGLENDVSEWDPVLAAELLR